MHEASDAPGGTPPTRAATSDGLKLALSTFGLLALELATIRWLSGQVRIFAYLNNLVLICVFLGMGLGVALARRRPAARRWILPCFFGFVALILAARPWLAPISFPDMSIHLWGAEHVGEWTQIVLSLSAVLTLLALVVGCFLLQGVAVGTYFGRLPTLQAYSLDLGGSLAGVVAFTAVTAAHAPPAVWFLVGAVPFLLIDRRFANVLACAGIVAVGWLSGRDSIYSPYNKIQLTPLPDGDIRLSVNQDFHQYLHDLSPGREGGGIRNGEATRAGVRAVYDLPYRLANRTGRALILGAGGGNDAQAALRNGFDSVYAVDIDPEILAIGEALHPEGPYDDPRVVPVVNDARAFLQRYDGPPFDVVSYGFVDSHAMFSAMSSLRLENYVYTEEGLGAAWDLLAPDGVMAVAFSVAAGPWIQDRLHWTLAAATGRNPEIVAHNLYLGSSFVVSKDPEDRLDQDVFVTVEPERPAERVRTTSDDWPFLYLQPGSVPWAYLLILAGLLTGGAFAVRAVFGESMARGGFDAPLFFMGAAFLLLETRGVTQLSLLFGSTWVVNSAVFSGILLTVLIANLGVEHWKPRRDGPWFVPLLASLLVLWLLPPHLLAGFDPLTRGIVGGLLVGLPVGFAGVIVSIRLARSQNPTGALGSNLLGAVLGGCLEYASMYVGLRALLLMAAALYVLAWATSRVGSGGRAGPDAIFTTAPAPH